MPKLITTLATAAFAAVVLGFALIWIFPPGSRSQGSGEAKQLGAAATPTVEPPLLPASGSGPNKPSSAPKASEQIDSEDWRKAKQGLERATNYRAFIHEATSSPTLARVAMAQRAFEACATLAAWAKRPDRPHTDAWHPDLLSAMSRLQERCTPPVADLSLALRHASARLGYGEMVGDAWLRSLIQREGLDALVRLGDGDVLALLGTQLDAATVHGLSPGLNAGLFSAAWVTLACQQYACDSMSWRLRVCLHFDSCSANELSAQLTAATAAASPQQWAQARSAAQALLASAIRRSP